MSSGAGFQENMSSSVALIVEPTLSRWDVDLPLSCADECLPDRRVATLHKSSAWKTPCAEQLTLKEQPSLMEKTRSISLRVGVEAGP